MAPLQILQTLALCAGMLGFLPVFAAPAFNSSEIETNRDEIMFGDLDGDHLEDIILLDQTNLLVFFQDAKTGFPRKPQQTVQSDGKPAIVWPATLGTNGCLLVMTSEGVAELDFANRTNPPVRQQIIRQPTIVPDTLDYRQMIYFPLSANSGADWPLILVPVADGLQVWQHRDEWKQVQFIDRAMDTRVAPMVRDPGYTQYMGLNLCIQDVNGDGRDDLMLMRRTAEGLEVYSLYLQDTNGQFNLEPALTYTNKEEWGTALSWMDINHDGKLDLIKCKLSDEPSFVPGLQSGKVLVATYLADAHGGIPPAPQQVFRKADWSAFLPMVDVDGDGYTDLVLGYIPVDSRDQFRGIITLGKVDLNLKFHFYRPSSGFSEEPDFQRTVQVYFDDSLIWSEENRIYTEKFLTLNGDFNGDGKKDLLVRDHSDGISAYFFHSRESGFSARADITFHCPEPVESWTVRDLNNDGISDLVVTLGGGHGFKIFTSQRE